MVPAFSSFDFFHAFLYCARSYFSGKDVYPILLSRDKLVGPGQNNEGLSLVIAKYVHVLVML